MAERLATPHPDDPLPEGAERPPPGTRAMAIVRWSLVALMAVAAAGAWVYHASSAGVLGRAEHRYHCPMHPTVVADHAGECPICGMDLVPIGAAGEAKPAAHPAPAGGAAPAATGPLYTCPMHPAFVTADPKARCPDCGMKLVPQEPQAAAAPASAQGVPGLAPVDLTVDRIQLMGMRTAAAVREPLAASLRTTGFVTPDETGLVSVTARFSGWIEALKVGETGQLVEKGTVLATVYSPDLVNAQQVYLNALKWSERGRSQAPAGPAVNPPNPQSDLEKDARTRLELLGVAPEDIDQLARTGVATQAMNVRAPARGHVARKGVLRGQYVQPGTELFQLADLSTVWVLADVYEAEIARVRVGQRAALELAAWPGERFEGKVQFIYPALNPGSRTLQARLAFRNPGLRLRPGMYGSVTLDAGAGRDALVVPRDAVVDTGDVQYVFVARGQGRFEPRRVRVGAGSGGKVAVLEGLAEGEKVVTAASFVLDSESRLRAALEGAGAGAGR